QHHREKERPDQREEFIRGAARRFDLAVRRHLFSLDLGLLQQAVARRAGNSLVEQAPPDGVIELVINRRKVGGGKLALPHEGGDVSGRQVIRIYQITGGDLSAEQVGQRLVQTGVRSESDLAPSNREERLFLGRLIFFCGGGQGLRFEYFCLI